MTVNAYGKIKQTLGKLLEEIPFEKRELSEEEIEEKMENGCGKGGYGLHFFKYREKPTFSAIEYAFSNGLFFLDSETHYTDKDGNLRTMRQFTLTSDYNNEPFVNIALSRDLKSYRQLITKTAPRDKLFPLEEKDIEIEEVKINVDATCGDIFTTYMDLKKGTILKEEYCQGYSIVDQYLSSSPKLFKLCGCFSRKLEILYGGDSTTPIYAQLSDKYRVEDVGFYANSKEDALEIVRIVNVEVDAIIQKIQSLVDAYRKDCKGVQKTIGTNPQI